MRTSGVILDIYDDTKGFVLREKLAGANLPAPLASSSLLPLEKLASLPDRLFALVAVDGDQVFRKYAMHDAEHLATSIIYFLECGHLLPKEAQNAASINLVNACDWYDINPPEPLVKQAILGKALALGAAGGAGYVAKQTMDKNQQAQNQYKQIQMGQVPAQGSHVKHATLFDEMMGATGAKAPPVAKTADLSGTEMMPMSGSLSTKPIGTNTAKKRSNATSSKNAAWQGPVDITGLSAPVVEVATIVTHFALPGKYPIDTYGQVKQAEAYFDEHWSAFDLPERRTFSLNLVDRANEVGVKVAGRALDYAGHCKGPHLRAEIQKRASSFEGVSAGAVYEDLKKTAAKISAADLVGLLHELDKVSGADKAYGKLVVGFRDPYAAVFGIKVAKDQITGDTDADAYADHEAKNEYVWNMGSDYVTGDQLRFMASRNEELDGVLGKGFSTEFNKDPVGTFKSLPDPQKHVLARLATDNSGGTSRQ